MKKRQKMSVLLFALVVWIVAALSVGAASQTADGLNVSLQTDKQEYEANESITAKLVVKNTNNFAVENVSVECLIPLGYRAENDTILTIPTLASGDEISMTVVLLSDVEVSPETGDSGKLIFWGLIGFLAAGILVVAFVGTGKNRRGIVAIFLSLAMLTASAYIGNAEALAADTGTMTVQETVKVGNDTLTIEGKVTYELPEAVETEETLKIYVSPDGDDANGDGSESNPYATIQAAKSAAAALKKDTQAVDVIFKAGVYRVDSTVVFTAEDSGSEGAPIRYMAEDGAEVVFTGAKPVDVTKFTAVTGDILERIKTEVQDKVMQIDLGTQGFTAEVYNFAADGNYKVTDRVKILNITLNGTLQNIARWPNSGYETVTGCEWDGNVNSPITIYYTSNDPNRWTQAKDFFIDGFLMHDWHPEWVKVDSVDILTNSIKTKDRTGYGVTLGSKWAAVNLVEELDIPGEWYIDFDTMIMYYYPPHELTEEDSMEIASVSEQIVKLDGASYIEFDGIHFTMTKGFYTGSSAIYTSEETHDILIKDCMVDYTTGDGIELNGTNITIDGCVIKSTGESGIYVNKCGDKNTLEPGNVLIRNCDISKPSMYHGHNSAAGIETTAEAVEITAINNVIHHCPNSAIRYSGSGHRFAYNEIYNCMNQAADAGAIYTVRSMVWYGNVAEYNLFHDLGSRERLSNYSAYAMFWDDLMSGCEFSHNIAIFDGADRTSGVAIGGGTDNTVLGNTIVSAGNKSITANERKTTVGYEYWEDLLNNTFRYNTVPVQSEAYKNKYPLMTSLLERIAANGGILRRDNIITDNLGVGCKEGVVLSGTMGTDAVVERNVELGSEYLNIFVDPENLDYRVKKSAKEQYGISDEILDEDFDLDLIGIQENKMVDLSSTRLYATYPENGCNTVNADNVYIAWTEVPLADIYTYAVAEDEAFTQMVAEEFTIYTGAKITGLEKGKTYYWKVTAHNISREYGCDIPVDGCVMSFTTDNKITLDTSGLELALSRAETLLGTITEGTNPGEYRIGTTAELAGRIETGKGCLANIDAVESQAVIDELTYRLNRLVNNIGAYVNVGYATLQIDADSNWYVRSSKTTTITPTEGALSISTTKGTNHVSLQETLSNNNILCFKMKLNSFDDVSWVAAGLRAQNKKTYLYGQDAYYFLVKEGIFELQKKGVIYETAVNEGKFKLGEWNDVEFGAVTTVSGVNLYLKINGEVIFDYLDRTPEQTLPGMFAITLKTGGTGQVEIKAADQVSTGCYEFSEKMQQEINSDTYQGGSETTADSSYSESGTWADKTDVYGDDGAVVRSTTTEGAYGTWELNAGNSGNGKVYKVSYYHIPVTSGDINAIVMVSGYDGDYTTTIDLSGGSEGYVELGTFKFMGADYMGRLSVKFTCSGAGELNLSNIKYELAEDAEDMLLAQ